MEPNKLENQIREKLNAREIKPSAASWDRLDAMLSVAENKKPKRNLNWLYIAAGIIGFVFVGLFFFNQNNGSSEINSNSTMVETNSKELNSVKEQSSKETLLQANPSIQNQTTVKNTVIASVSKTKNEYEKGKVNPVQKQQFSNTVIAEKENIAEVVLPKSEENRNETINKTTLLASNETKKPEKNIQNKPKLKIDANALLSQVDGEIELTFRQKVIKKVAKNFESAREAVVSRNQE
ncbi:hypothetical protein [Flavobacterium sp.]|uniref:hypothetical protein n=1 Tax=Flavobacterium sp. TaxID=239 RepID=UPI002619FD8F|nr:hypothetical protein [Flavobacterium sp.]